jgi:hypothetical protein
MIMWAGLLMSATSQTTSNLVVIPSALDADWENGRWDSGLRPAPVLSFQNGNDANVTLVPDTNRYVEASTNFARSGSYSFKAFGQPPAKRSEIAFMDKAYQFSNGKECYYAVSYCPDNSWLTTCPWSVILTQWKTFESGPSAVFRLTNDGTHRAFFMGPGMTTKHYFGELPLNEWTDFVFYFKWAADSSGVTKIWKNGVLVLDLTGPTLLANGNGYMKIGMYTEIGQPRTIYIDNVRIGTSLQTD